MFNIIRGKLIVSCQALKGEPLHDSYIMGKMALAAKQGGASAIRAQGVEDILEIKNVVNLPIIGLIKKKYEDSEVYITPTHKEVAQLIEADCDMIALDATQRERPNGELLINLLNQIKKSGKLSMADCSTLEEMVDAEKIGFDCVSTTLSGYTSYSKKLDGPDYELIEDAVNIISIPVIAEGKVHYPYQLKKVFDLGVYSAVVGGAITRPKEITERFTSVLK